MSKVRRYLTVHALTDVKSPAAEIERLERELEAARNRASVAEDQLRRVHTAVRAFKEKQIDARATNTANALATEKAAKVEASPSGIYTSWAVNDPSLDERLDEYLSSEFEPDRSRDWMLNG